MPLLGAGFDLLRVVIRPSDAKRASRSHAADGRRRSKRARGLKKNPAANPRAVIVKRSGKIGNSGMEGGSRTSSREGWALAGPSRNRSTKDCTAACALTGSDDCTEM